MTVKQLIKLLEREDPDLLVILSKDSEGNQFSPLDKQFGVGMYTPDTTYSGEYVSSDDPEYEELTCANSKDALVLWPVN